MKTLAMSFGILVLLSGCAAGITPETSALSVSYTVPYNYQIVYMRAENQADECLHDGSRFVVHIRVNPATQSGVVSVLDASTQIELARTELKAVDVKYTQVHQVVLGKSPWDARALRAMRESIRQDVSICSVHQ